MRDDLKVGLQYLAPKQALTRVMGKLASLKGGWFTTSVIKWFIKQYQVDMGEAKVSDPGYYRTFNDFFVRELKPALRPMRQSSGTHRARAINPSQRPLLFINRINRR